MAQSGIDVVEDFRYDSRNPRYNRAYHDWRKKTHAPCMYRYQKESQARTYTSGRANVEQEAPVAERVALLHTGEYIGLAMLVCLLIETLGGLLLVWLLGRLGVSIRLDFLTFEMHGSQWATAAVRALMILLKFGIPLILLIRSMKLPSRVIMPVRLGELPEITGAFGFAMLTAALFSALDNANGITLSQRIFSYQDSATAFAYGLFEVLVSSLLAELLLRGAVLQGLRQFGDRFAVLLTGMIGFVMPNTLPRRLSELLIGLCAGYLLLRGGSILHCVLLRAIFTAMTYARLVLVYANHVLPLWGYVCLLLSIGAVAASFYVLARRGTLRLSNRSTALPDSRKLITFTETITTFPWLGLSALLAIVQIVL